MANINSRWISDFHDLEYFIVTIDAIVGVYKEDDERVFGYVICGKADVDCDIKINLDKNLVVKALHNGRLEIVEEIPEWFYGASGFANSETNNK